MALFDSRLILFLGVVFFALAAVLADSASAMPH